MSELLVRWPLLDNLTCKLTKVHLRPKNLVTTEALREVEILQQDLSMSSGQAPPPPLQEGGTVKMTKQGAKEEVADPSPIAQLQIGQKFKLRLSMEMAEKMTVEGALITKNGCP